MQQLLSEVRSLTITFLIAFVIGYLFKHLGFPAPFLLGSLFGVWFFGGTIRSVREKLAVPRWVFVPVALGLGTLIGGNFRPDVIAHLGAAAVTVSTMVGATILATLVGLTYLMKVRKYSFIMALLSCIPGGQAEAVLMSRDLVEKDYVVALFHLVRVAIVFCSTPLILALVQGEAAVIASTIALEAMPSASSLDMDTLFVFASVSICSLPLAQLLRIPMPHLVGPILISSALHIAGLIEVPRISEFVILAQLTIGGSVGARLAKVPFVELAPYIRDAVTNSILVLMTYGLLALAISRITDINFIQLLLAFVPGGLYEVTLLALIFGFDVAFVAFHHTIRVMMVCIGLPLIAGFAQKHQANSKKTNPPT